MKDIAKGGARHSKGDTQKIQDIFNYAVALGAVCPNCANGTPQKATLNDIEARVFSAFYEMINRGGMEYGGAWPFALYNNTIVLRTGDGRYVAYRYADVDGAVLFGEPYDVDMMFVPITDSDMVAAEISGAVKSTDDSQNTDTADTSGAAANPDTDTSTTDTTMPDAHEGGETKSANYPYFDNSLRVIRKDDETVTVGNYLLTYGKPDLEGHGSSRVNPDGSKGEYFTPETKWASPYTESGTLHVDWEHGGDVSTPELAGEHGILGYADVSTAKSDERGLFIERTLSRRNKYVDWLTDLIEAGKVGTSSQAIRGRTKRAEDGFIEQWPLFRDSLTVNPMQWENVGDLPDSVINSLKALAEASPALANELKTAGIFAGADSEPVKPDNTSGGEYDRGRVSAAVEIEGELIDIKNKLGE